ncbi:MAG TPA: single-stranded DNA-binding protein [Niabella sp.]|jgi:single-strand DNA-binding protein|nr:single-stranded DNA-binding protein [Chitinophagaceae bacterium]HRN48630.1 single-stranded DNA-binding protein [Niabella sp.]HRO83273.1 single-stranded DNA-binding protein [Niabella sp.]HUN02646.1 single-stranded DNA-binding protein [Niabella sp.]
MLKMQVIGNLGKDCVVNNVKGKNVINFTVAHTEKYKDSQGVNQERTTWIECAWWTDRTNVSPYLTKGKQIYAEGTPEVRSYTRNDGSPGAALSLRVRELQLLGGKSEAVVTSGVQVTTQGGGEPTFTPSSSASEEAGEPADDLPF